MNQEGFLILATQALLEALITLQRFNVLPALQLQLALRQRENPQALVAVLDTDMVSRPTVIAERRQQALELNLPSRLQPDLAPRRYQVWRSLRIPVLLADKAMNSSNITRRLSAGSGQK